MLPNSSFTAEQRRLQALWFQQHLAAECGFSGSPYRLHPENRLLNLAPQLRDSAELLFNAEPSIQWHQHANHGLSSQVCCLNFLLPFADRPALLRCWVEHVTGDQVQEMLPVEASRAGQPWFVTFEWIGERDYLDEGNKQGVRHRGANATAADAALLYRDTSGHTQLLLIEWKYTEQYGAGLDPKGNATRLKRYMDIFRYPNGPVRFDADVDLADFFYEPFYQMLRQQMLAWHTLQHSADIDRVRVLHLSHAGNLALHRVTSPNLRRFGDDAFDVFRSLLVDPQDFTSLSIGKAFQPLIEWPEADWVPWLRSRYSALWSKENVDASR